MRFLLPLIASTLFLTRKVESVWTPKPGTTWGYLLAASKTDILNSKEQVVTLDVNTEPELISKLHSKGQKVICYFSGGTLESNRKDYNQYLAIPGLVRDKYTKWNELWIDVRMKDKLRPLIKNRMKMAISKNCDAVEVDCLGAFNHKEVQNWPDPLTRNDAKVFALWLSDLAHELGISIGLKNIATIAPELVDHFDFAVVESCSSSPNICAKYKDFPKQGKAVFTIHYGDYGSFESQKARMVREQKGFGYTCTFNNDDNLKQPGFAYNCDTGSRSNIGGSIPKVTNTPSNKPSVGAGSSSNKSGPVTNTGFDRYADPNGAVSPSVANKLGNANGNANGNVNGNVNGNINGNANGNTNANGNGLGNGANAGVNNGLGNNSGIINGNTTQAIGQDVTAKDAAGANNNNNNNNNNSIVGDNNENGNKSSKSKKGITIAAVAAGGSAIGAAAFFLIKKHKKKNQFVGSSTSVEDIINYNDNYRY